MLKSMGLRVLENDLVSQVFKGPPTSNHIHPSEDLTHPLVEAVSWRILEDRALYQRVLDARLSLIHLSQQNEIAVLDSTVIHRHNLKDLKVSPDSFFQMAMQLAYYRDQGTFTSTYETASTRAFFHGRTEAIRPLSVASIAWVKSMSDIHATVEKRVQVLRLAMKSHLTYIKFSSNGKGWDRHFMGLKLIALENNLPLPAFFAHPIFSRTSDFGLSTSNMSTGTSDVTGMLYFIYFLFIIIFLF